MRDGVKVLIASREAWSGRVLSLGAEMDMFRGIVMPRFLFYMAVRYGI